MGLLTISDLSGLGQASECGPKPGLGPGEKAQCCPDVGWVVYDQSESPYALCERAKAVATGESAAPETAGSALERSLQRIEAQRMAAEAELEARRQEIEERRAALEERRFQQQLQSALLKARLKATQAAKARSPEVLAAKAAAARAAAAAAEARAAAERRKNLTYAAVAALAAKLLFF